MARGAHARNKHAKLTKTRATRENYSDQTLKYSSIILY